jgi:class 3 adenylate cyclase
MKIKRGSYCRKCLQQSLPVDMMIRFASHVYPEYNIYKEAGLKEHQPLSSQNAAFRIVEDFIAAERFIDLVEFLIQVDLKGYMGRQYSLRGLNDVISGIIREGYSYDNTTGQFFENQSARITSNWGRLIDGDERNMAVLRLDVAANSVLVKQNNSKAVEKAYKDLRAIVSQAVINRLGRLWSWEGDGALAVFLFRHKEQAVVFAGMNILHDLYLYNRLVNPLNAPVNVRIAAHAGPVQYRDNEAELLKSETIRETLNIESHAVSVGSFGVSDGIFLSIDKGLQDLFRQGKYIDGIQVKTYGVEVKQP